MIRVPSSPARRKKSCQWRLQQLLHCQFSGSFVVKFLRGLACVKSLKPKTSQAHRRPGGISGLGMFRGRCYSGIRETRKIWEVSDHDATRKMHPHMTALCLSDSIVISLLPIHLVVPRVATEKRENLLQRTAPCINAFKSSEKEGENFALYSSQYLEFHCFKVCRSQECAIRRECLVTYTSHSRQTSFDSPVCPPIPSRGEAKLCLGSRNTRTVEAIGEYRRH